MKILVLGGTAWLGREISEQAIHRDHDVVCLARGRSGAAPERATLINSDRERPDAFSRLKGLTWDAVIEISWQPGLVREALAALGSDARHWTYISSGSVYASQDKPGIDETAALLPATELQQVGRSLYGEAKVACELACLDAVGDRLLTVRPGLIGGPGDHTGRTGYWVARAARNQVSPLLVPAAPQALTQMIDARDLAAWVLRCAEKRVTGTYNAVGPSIPLTEWISLSRQIGRHTVGIPIHKVSETPECLPQDEGWR